MRLWEVQTGAQRHSLKHIPELRRFARALLGGDQDRADDLLQDSLKRALSGWHQRRCVKTCGVGSTQ